MRRHLLLAAAIVHVCACAGAGADSNGTEAAISTSPDVGKPADGDQQPADGGASAIDGPTQQQPDAGAPTAAPDLLLADRTLVFRPSRDDITVGTAVLTLHCARESTQAEYQATRRKAHVCDDFVVDGAKLTNIWHTIELKEVAKNQFQLGTRAVDFSTARDGHLCLSIKIWFKEVSNQWDSLFYRDVDDRYALLAYCTSNRRYAWVDTRPRFGMNRVQTVAELESALDAPFDIALTERPLPR